MKKYSSRRRRRSYKPRRYKRRRGSKRNLMQKLESAGVRKKYTRVFTPRWPANVDNCSGTISLCGGTYNTSGQACTNLFQVDPDDQTTQDMKLYQQFCIYGVKLKWFFAEPTTQDASPVQWSLCYSPNIMINSALDFDRMQTLASYQTGPCSQNRSISRYYALGYTKKKLGIDYDNTSAYALYGANPSAALYNGQLPAGAGPSVHFKIFRNGQSLTAQTAARLQVTYYVKYRGTRGVNSIA